MPSMHRTRVRAGRAQTSQIARGACSTAVGPLPFHRTPYPSLQPAVNHRFPLPALFERTSEGTMSPLATHFRFIFLVVCLCSPSSLVTASPLLELIGDTTSGGGLQARTRAGGTAAAYFNPALLTAAPAGLNAGFMVLSQQIGITVAGRPGTQYSVPAGIHNAGHADYTRFSHYPVPTNLLQYGRPETEDLTAFKARPRQGQGSGIETYTYEVFGANIKLFEDRIAFGIHGLVPNGQFTKLRAFWSDEREQYFSNSLHPELYADRLTALSLGAGVGLQITKGLSVGAGATLGLVAEVVAPAFVPDTSDLTALLLDTDAGVNMAVTPHLGISYAFNKSLRASATLQMPKEQRLAAQFAYQLAHGIEQSSLVAVGSAAVSISYWAAAHPIGAVTMETAPELAAGGPENGTKPPDSELHNTLSAVAQDSTVQREIAYLVRVRDALQDNPQQAYGWLLRSERAFPNAILQEERDSLHLQVLARLGKRDAARRRARAFLTRYPTSPARAVAFDILQE